MPEVAPPDQKDFPLPSREGLGEGARHQTNPSINDAPIFPGTQVVLSAFPDDLRPLLDKEAELAITKAVGKTMTVEGSDDLGRIELMFHDDNGNIRFIWGDPKYVAATGLGG